MDFSSFYAFYMPRSYHPPSLDHPNNMYYQPMCTLSLTYKFIRKIAVSFSSETKVLRAM